MLYTNSISTKKCGLKLPLKGENSMLLCMTEDIQTKNC